MKVQNLEAKQVGDLEQELLSVLVNLLALFIHFPVYSDLTFTLHVDSILINLNPSCVMNVMMYNLHNIRVVAKM